MLIADLFPTCNSKACPDKGRHKHILSSQREFIQATERFVCNCGGWRSGKTYSACVLCLLLMLNVPGNRGFIGRRSYNLLHDTTLRVFLEVLERAEIEGVEYLEKFQSFPHRLVLPNQSEVVFRETKDVGRWLGPEYGFFYLDEAMSEPESTFKGLVGRLCLPRAEGHLRGILTTNPPYDTHWIAQRFGQDAGVRGDSPATYRLIKTSSRENIHLPEGYIDTVTATVSKAEAHRVVEGNFGFVTEGPPVYPEFSTDKHVQKGVALLPVEIIRGWDFGFRHPACTWLQNHWCRTRTLHTRVLAELDRNAITAENFATDVLAVSKAKFPTIPATMYQDGADCAGAHHTDKGPGPIIRLAAKPWSLRFRYLKRHDIDPLLDFIREQLRATCTCGLPVVLIDASCRGLIDALAGGYHYPAKRVSPYKPVKDGHYDDIADSLRYAIDNFVRMTYLKSKATPWPQAQTPHPAPPAWGWMVS